MENMTLNSLTASEEVPENLGRLSSGAGDQADQPAIDRLEALLSNPNPDKEAIHDAVHALSSDDLVSYGLNAYRMNLLSLFSETRTHEEIEDTARQAAICKIWRGWEHHYYLSQLKPQHGEVQLENVPTQIIKDRLAEGRGLVLTTFHQGHYRYLPTEFARIGVPFCLALATDAYGDYTKSRSQAPNAVTWKYMTFVNVEEMRGSLHLARILAKGGAILSALDGNTGLDGPRGHDSRAIVDILGCKARVKTGSIKLAARFGSPIMAMSAHEIDGVRQLHAGPFIDPGRPLRGQDAEDFVNQATEELYAHFADNLTHYAHEWGGGDLFHQWRIPEKALKRPLEEAENIVSTILEQGKSVTRNVRRIVETRKTDEITWIDAHTLQCFRIPDSMHWFAKHLSPGSQRVNRDWINRQTPEDKARIQAFLRNFAAMDAISAI